MAFFNAHDFAVEVCQSLQSAIDLDLVLGQQRPEGAHHRRWSFISFPSRPRSSARSDAGISFRSRPKSSPKSDIEEKVAAVIADDEKLDSSDSNEISLNIQDEDKYDHLDPAEAEVLKRQIDVPITDAGLKTLYRYATTNDKIIIAVSLFCAIASGAAIPLMTVVYGGLADKFKDFFTGAISRSAFSDEIAHQVLYLVYIGAAEFVTIYISTVGFMYTGEHIAGKVRAQYLEACLRQNIGFFDEMGAGEITTRITADMNMVQDGISEKVALTLNALSTFVTAFVISFIKSWKLTLILSASCVAITLVVAIGSNINIKYKKEALQCYALGGTVAEEAISSIRNAVAFGTQDKLARQYEKHLTEAEYYGFKEKRIFAVALGGMNLIIYLNYGLAFWVSSMFLVNGEIALSSILTILMSVMMGAFSLGNVAPNVQAFTTAISAASKIFSTIDRVSPLDPTSTEGQKLKDVRGTIELRHIKHIYPSRPEVVVMNDVSLIIPAGKKTALVGASGSGKSTIVGLVERFYDPVYGQVFLDGHDIRTLNLRWIRQQMALVSQEPVLFQASILDNIAYGLIGSKYEDERGHERMRRVVEAAKLANAHEFISELPRGYATNVGQRGSLLSGGQKQRIAIARAIVSNPKILLLDEATSALDTKSEGVVQAALDAAAEGRTTIVIAHRLSTIKDSDNIVVMNQGRIVEQGTHEYLLKLRGVYASLVEAQTIAEAEELTAEEEIYIDEKDDLLARQQLPGLPLAGDKTVLKEKIEKNDDFGIIKIEPADEHFHLPARVKEIQYSLWTLIKMIASFNRAEWYWMLLGLAFSIVCGGGNPVQEVFSAKQIVALSTPVYIPNTPFEIPGAKSHIRSDVDYWSRLYVMLGVVLLVGYWIMGTTFAWCSERLIHRMRSLAFRTILRQDITFFDKDENTAGALTSFLSTETTFIAGLSGVTLGTFLVVLTTLIASVVIALAFAWKLALVCCSTIPILVGCGFLRFWLISQFQLRAQKVYTKSASFACEATNAIRTVASLTLEYDVLERYEYSLHVQGMSSLLSVMKSSILYAASQSLMFLCVGLGFWYGANQIADGAYGLFQFFVAFTSVVFGAQAAGTVFSFAPDMGKAKQSAQKLKTLFDQKPVIDCWSEDGQPVKKIRGKVEFRNVHFRYPTRPEQPVLRGLDFTIKPGQYVALVGASGCGKSTSIALLERFYDPLQGGVYVDGKDISKLNINDYRSFVALVSQEPTLYQGTIRENILLGIGHEDVTDAQIEFACREANIYDFIISLPEGFNTAVGSKGSMLSGGQKQRIAIARALIRDPKILLLDEATSALDSESEFVVQAALDKAAKGRTTIAVAHRLSTIQKADVIHVLDQGVIIESGDHWQLMANRGRYFELVNLQSLSGMN